MVSEARARRLRMIISDRKQKNYRPFWQTVFKTFSLWSTSVNAGDIKASLQNSSAPTAIEKMQDLLLNELAYFDTNRDALLPKIK